MSAVINNRYILHEPLGHGAMGIVYRATDRLSGKTIALKRVMVSEENIEFASQGPSDDINNFRLALAREFQTLASLRHPNIISVLDYGFDERIQPYFTMNYLVKARTIIDAGKGKDIHIKGDFLIQLLQALVYLHRRGILHRDLKPGNILTTQDRIRVLDFGLSIPRDEARGRTGTLAYMAPETLQRGEAVEASDLYAVGVIAYQLFAEKLPFEASDIMGIISRPADLSKLNANPKIIAVIEKLLKKSPEERFENAHATVLALNNAVGQSNQLEDAAIRESFLQAATFVGREKELEQLTDALQKAQNGQGSTWLIGSESGVGKSRLLEEIRIRALVQGAHVLRGQAIEGQRQPYHLWHSPLRRLMLSVPLNDLESGVLKSILPDIDSLQDREIPDAPMLDDKDAAQRLISVIAGVVQKAATRKPPLVLLLEDIHWALGNLESLAWLSRIIKDLPLLIIATYRTEDAPDIQNILPDANRIFLQRFEPQAIAALSTSMLGELGAQPQILNLLQDETEGNVFFLVETVRALAEEAGSLYGIDSKTLPKVVFAGGVKRVIHRRLERVPDEHQPLLKLAAVAGRGLELDLLHTLIPEINLEKWLTTCANVAVLEIQDERWRFAHDKLRETLLERLDDKEKRDLNSQVARSLETTYASNLAPHYGRLAWHYSKSGELKKERWYAQFAGKYAASQYSHAEALKFFKQALKLTPENDLENRYDLIISQESIYGIQGNLDKQFELLKTLQGIVAQLDDKTKEANIYTNWTAYYYNQSNYPAAVETAQQALDLALSINQQDTALKTYNQIASILWKQNKLDEADFYAMTGLELARKTANKYFEPWLLNTKGLLEFQRRDLSSARECFQHSLSLALTNQDTQIQALALNNLGMVAGYQGDFQAAQDYYAQALKIAQESGTRRKQAMNLANLGWVSGLLGEYANAIDYTRENIQISREIGDLYNEAYGLINLSSYTCVTGEINTALQSARRAKELAIQIGDLSAKAWALTSLGHSYLAFDKFEKAEEVYLQALIIREELDQPLLGTEPAAGLARALLGQKNLTAAYRHIQSILPILDQNVALDGTDDPFRVYLTCYLVLRARNDGLADKILKTAHDLIQSRAAKILDPDTRKSFLENIPHHREIQDTWNRYQPRAT